MYLKVNSKTYDISYKTDMYNTGKELLINHKDPVLVKRYETTDKSMEEFTKICLALYQEEDFLDISDN